MIQIKIMLCLYGIYSTALAQDIHDVNNVIKTARDSQFPYQVNIFYHSYNTSKPRCSGGIIGSTFVLTAASCLIERSGAVRNQPLYTRYRDKASSSGLWTLRKVKKFYAPTSFDPSNPHSDANIAVLLLHIPLPLEFTYSKSWTTNGWFCLAKLSLSTSREPFRRKINVIIAGYTPRCWVSDRSREDVTGKLRYTMSQIIPDECCKSLTSHQYDLYITRHGSDRFCTENPRPMKGAHLGELGSPIVVNDKLVGVLSIVAPQVRHSRDRENVQVYTRVSYYQSFIEHAMRNVNGTDIRSYQRPNFAMDPLQLG